ncbi:MAG: succinate dehydrogenase assembly factor 2 [Denitrovibrio sp.]|nr:MAG: succinate dehydrogenase assembly factor 2 [Denitrovibrio sp.]
MEMLKKKAIFQAARRAILENEVFLKEFVVEHLPEDYNEQDMVDFNYMLEKIFDNDLFDIVMGNKQPSDFEGVYNQRFLTDIADFAVKKREAIKSNVDKRIL